MLALLALCAAFAQEVPERYQGVYWDADLARPLARGEIPGRQGLRRIEVTPRTVSTDFYMDTSEYEVSAIVPASGGIDLQTSSWMEDDRTWSLRDTDGVATLSDGGASWVRVADVAPAAAFFDAEDAYTAGVLARSFAEDGSGTSWLVLPEVDGNVAWGGDGERALVAWSEGERHEAEGGFGFQDVLVLDDTEWLLEPTDTGVLLEEAAPEDGPDRYALEGGARRDWRRRSAAPFRVLAARLTLRVAPGADAEKVGQLSGGTHVVALARTSDDQDVGMLAAPWYLVASKDGIGWAFGAYLGRSLGEEGGGDPEEIHPEALPWEQHLVVGTTPDGAVCRAVNGKRVGTPLEVPGGAMVAVGLLSDVHDDGDLDVVCVYANAAAVFACPLLWSMESDRWVPAGCVAAPRTSESEIPPIWFVDGDGDGDRDLHIGPAEAPVVGAWDGKAFAGTWTPPAPEPEPAPAQGSAPEAATPGEPAPSGGLGLCGCSTVAMFPVGLWWLAALFTRRADRVRRSGPRGSTGRPG